MTTQRVLGLLLVLGALGLPGCERGKTGETKGEETSKGAQALTDADRDAIKAGIARFDQSAVSGDWSAADSVYTDDVILLPPNMGEVRGRDAARKFLQGFPKMTVFKETVDEIQGDANLAYPLGTYETSMTPPGGKAPVKDKGKVMAVWRKTADGWRASRVIWNSDLPPAKM